MSGVCVYIKVKFFSEDVILDNSPKVTHFSNPVYDCNENKRERSPSRLRRRSRSSLDLDYEDDAMYHEPDTLENTYMEEEEGENFESYS